MARIRVCVGLGIAAAVALLGARTTPPADGKAARASEGSAASSPGLGDLRRANDAWDARVAAARARLAEKHAIAAALVRGDIGLREAVHRFGDLVRDEPAIMDGLRLRFPGATDDELRYRNVLFFAREAASHRPDLDPGVLDRLEAEFRAMFPAETRVPATGNPPPPPAGPPPAWVHPPTYSVGSSPQPSRDAP